MVKIARLAILMMVVSAGGCGRTPEVMIYSVSPNQSARITIYLHSRAPDFSVSMEVTDKHGILVKHQDKEDRLPMLAEVYWSPDSKEVGALVCESGGRYLVFGYDLSRSKILDAHIVLPGIRSALQGRYRPVGENLALFDGDTVRWACDPQSDLVAAFRRYVTSDKLLKDWRVPDQHGEEVTIKPQ